MADEPFKVYFPKNLEDRIEKFLETDEAKELVKQTKQDAVRHIVTKYLSNKEKKEN